MYIYKITNTINGKIYIGQHCKDDLQKYLQKNINAAMRGHKNKPRLYNAIRKYKAESFIIELLCTCMDKIQLDDTEKMFIRLMQTQNPDIGYNITDGGEGAFGRVGEKHPLFGKKCLWVLESNRQRMGIKHPMWGNKHSEESKRQMAKAHKGKKLSDITKQKVSEANKGKILSEETKRKMSEAAKVIWTKRKAA